MMRGEDPRGVLTVETEDGGQFEVEIRDDAADVGAASRRLRMKAIVLQSTIRQVATTVHRSVQEALTDPPPSKIEVEFGLKFTTKSPMGVIVGEVGGESSILVRIEWPGSTPR
ncbi:CU044_2847 family protein [Plantactinospora sp. WMMB782]|uniref:CU044_2847 family protein n=1 Tax=Plantactinospora sp. WMMB782 TaxID=3404121 RepID=UPI003B92FCA8